MVFSMSATIADAQDGAGPFRFRDVGKEAGFLPAAAGIQGHGAGIWLRVVAGSDCSLRSGGSNEMRRGGYVAAR